MGKEGAVFEHLTAVTLEDFARLSLDYLKAFIMTGKSTTTIREM